MSSHNVQHGKAFAVPVASSENPNTMYLRLENILRFVRCSSNEAQRLEISLFGDNGFGEEPRCGYDEGSISGLVDALHDEASNLYDLLIKLNGKVKTP